MIRIIRVSGVILKQAQNDNEEKLINCFYFKLLVNFKRMSEQDLNSQAPKPKEFAFTRLPSGELIGIFELMERHRNNGEIEISTSLLKPGDLLTFQYLQENANGFFIFKVKECEWRNLGMQENFAPSPLLSGQLQGDQLPNDVKDKTVFFVGSGFGGSIREPNILATGRAPYFALPEGEFRAPAIQNFKIFRKDTDGELRILDRAQVDAETKMDNARHLERLIRVEQLMNMFGFTDYDLKDSSKSSHSYEQVAINEALPQERILTYDDERYYAQYDAEMAMGNRLAILDKKTNQWMEFKYFNFKNDDFLQVAFTDLSGQDLDKIFMIPEWIVFANEILGSTSSITTFNSSNRYGIEAVNYQPTDEESRENLKIPSTGSHRLFRPNIQLWPNGEIKVGVDSGLLYTDTLDKDPCLPERISTTVKLNTTPDGAISLDLNGKNIQLKNPDAEIESLIQHLTKKRATEMDAGTRKEATRIRKAIHTIGNFIRKKKS